MPRMPLPRELDLLVARPSPAVVGTVRPDGSPHTAATWYDWEGGRVLLNMDESHTGKPFGTRDRRRVTAWMRPERWSSWPLPRP
jgi:hypothetical protein